MKIALLALALMFAGCGHAIPSAPQTLPNLGTTWAVVVHPPVAPADLSAITALGFNAIRVDYDPAQFDYSWVPTALGDGLKIVFITPYIAKGEAFDPASYAAVVAAGAKTWPGQTWELINEPNNQGPLNEQQLTPAQYVTLAQAVAPALRAADPAAKLYGGGVSMGGTYPIDTWFAGIAPAFPLFDAQGAHPYAVADLKTFVAKYTVATRRPIAITEWGESPQSPADLTAMLETVNGATPLFALYEYENQPGESTNYGIAGTPSAAAISALLR